MLRSFLPIDRKRLASLLQSLISRFINLLFHVSIIESHLEDNIDRLELDSNRSILLAIDFGLFKINVRGGLNRIHRHHIG